MSSADLAALLDDRGRVRDPCPLCGHILGRPGDRLSGFICSAPLDLAEPWSCPVADARRAAGTAVGPTG